MRSRLSGAWRGVARMRSEILGEARHNAVMFALAETYVSSRLGGDRSAMRDLTHVATGGP